MSDVSKSENGLLAWCLENMAEREGFYYRRYLQVAVNPTLPR